MSRQNLFTKYFSKETVPNKEKNILKMAQNRGIHPKNASKIPKMAPSKEVHTMRTFSGEVTITVKIY